MDPVEATIQKFILEAERLSLWIPFVGQGFIRRLFFCTNLLTYKTKYSLGTLKFPLLTKNTPTQSLTQLAQT